MLLMLGAGARSAILSKEREHTRAQRPSFISMVTLHTSADPFASAANQIHPTVIQPPTAISTSPPLMRSSTTVVGTLSAYSISDVWTV